MNVKIGLLCDLVYFTYFDLGSIQGAQIKNGKIYILLAQQSYMIALYNYTASFVSWLLILILTLSIYCFFFFVVHKSRIFLQISSGRYGRSTLSKTVHLTRKTAFQSVQGVYGAEKGSTNSTFPPPLFTPAIINGFLFFVSRR